MSEQDWSNGGLKSVMVFLNGCAIAGTDAKGERIVDDSFLLLFNAHDQAGAFHGGRRPRPSRRGECDSTRARAGRAPPAAGSAPANASASTGAAVLILTNRSGTFSVQTVASSVRQIAAAAFVQSLLDHLFLPRPASAGSPTSPGSPSASCGAPRISRFVSLSSRCRSRSWPVCDGLPPVSSCYRGTARHGTGAATAA